MSSISCTLIIPNLPEKKIFTLSPITAVILLCNRLQKPVCRPVSPGKSGRFGLKMLKRFASWDGKIPSKLEK